MADHLEFSYDVSEDKHVDRKSYRAKFKGLFARIDNGTNLYEIESISSSGCTIVGEDNAFKLNSIVHLDVVISNKIIIRSLQTKIVRLLSDSVKACAFHEITRQQEHGLDKLVLEIQKISIAKAKT